jgi:hypothetical protein
VEGETEGIIIDVNAESAGCCEHSNEPLNSINGREFLD